MKACSFGISSSFSLPVKSGMPRSLKGPFRDQGMPDFTGRLKEEDIPKLQAFIQGTADAVRPKK